MAKIEQKQVIVNEIKEKLEKATSVVMVDARGLTVEQDTALRKQLREAGVDYKVYKNTMVHFAIQGTQFEGLSEYHICPAPAHSHSLMKMQLLAQASSTKLQKT